MKSQIKRYVFTYILKLKLAGIFKQAELCSERGRQAGDQVFVELCDQAHKLIGQHLHVYADFNVRTEIPAMEDLEALTIRPVRPNPLAMAGVVATVVIIGGMFLSVYAALLHNTYVLVVRHIGG